MRAFPEPVRLRVGGAPWEAQLERKVPWAKPIRGLGGGDVQQVEDNNDGDT